MIVILVMIFFMAKWIFRLHKDLNEIFPDYPITPRKALYMTLIPFYNAWGIWKVFLRFQINEVDLSWNNIKIQTLYIVMLILSGIENALTKLTEGVIYSTYDFSIKLSVDVALSFTMILSPILWYLMVSVVMNGLIELKSHSKLL